MKERARISFVHDLLSEILDDGGFFARDAEIAQAEADLGLSVDEMKGQMRAQRNILCWVLSHKTGEKFDAIITAMTVFLIEKQERARRN
jgi:hypothetical protein